MSLLLLYLKNCKQIKELQKNHLITIINMFIVLEKNMLMKLCGPILPCVQTEGKEARPNIIPIHTNGARKGPAQYPVRGQTKVRGQPFEEWTKLPSEES